MGCRDFSLPAVGCGYDNDEGSSHQFKLAECRPGDPLGLCRESLNPHDAQAVAIVTASGICVSYLARGGAAWLA